MDFSVEAMHESHGLMCGQYSPVAKDKLPPLYVAFDQSTGEPTEVFHNNLRGRFEQGEKAVVTAMAKFAELTVKALQAIETGNKQQLAGIINENFDIRRSICQLPTGQIQMVEVARSVGASAKFAGSGGAIVGTYTDERMFKQLNQQLKAIGCKVHAIN